MQVSKTGYRIALSVIAIGGCIGVAGGVLLAQMIFGQRSSGWIGITLGLMFGGPILGGIAGYWVGAYKRPDL